MVSHTGPVAEPAVRRAAARRPRVAPSAPEAPARHAWRRPGPGSCGPRCGSARQAGFFKKVPLAPRGRPSGAGARARHAWLRSRAAVPARRAARTLSRARSGRVRPPPSPYTGPNPRPCACGPATGSAPGPAGRPAAGLYAGPRLPAPQGPSGPPAARGIRLRTVSCAMQGPPAVLRDESPFLGAIQAGSLSPAFGSASSTWGFPGSAALMPGSLFPSADFLHCPAVWVLALKRKVLCRTTT